MTSTVGTLVVQQQYGYSRQGLSMFPNSSSAHAGDSPPGGKENGAPSNAASTVTQGESEGLQSSGQPQANGVRSMRRERPEGLAALLDSPDMPTGKAGPYAFRRQLGASKPISNREPSLAHVAASNSADLGAVTHAMAHARTLPDQKPPKPEQPKQAAANSPKALANGSDQAQQQPFAGFAASSSVGNQYASSAAGDSSMQNRFLSPFSQPQAAGLDPMDAFAHLPEGLRIQLQAPGAEDMSRTNSLVYNQVCPHVTAVLQCVVVSSPVICRMLQL